MFKTLVLPLFLLITTITSTKSQSCSTIIQLATQSFIDTQPIDNGSFTCIYRCHPSNIGNDLIDEAGIDSIFVIELCNYNGECQTFTNEGPIFDKFSNGKYYYSQDIFHTETTDIFTFTCTYTAKENGSICHNESFVRYLTRNLPLLIPEETEYTVNIGSQFSTDLTIFITSPTELFDIDNFIFRKALKNSYFPIEASGTFMQLKLKLRTVITTEDNVLVITTFTIQTQSLSPSHIGRYVYAYTLFNLSNGFTLTANVTDFCEISYQYGLVWPGLIHGAFWQEDCSDLGEFFEADGQLYLACDANSGFSMTSECLMLIDSAVIEIIFLPNLDFLVHSINDIILKLGSLTGIPTASFTTHIVLNTVLQTEFTYLSIPIPENVVSNTIIQIEDYLALNMEILSHTLVEIQAFIPSKTCYCDFDITNDFPLQENIFEICGNRSCDCPAVGNCSCNDGHTGTGKECGIDTDTDGYPDHLLTCISQQNYTYCQQDNCPTDSNSDQLDCDMNGQGDACDGPICPFDRDMYGVSWLCGVGNGLIDSQSCFSGIGIAYRECDLSGNWVETNISECASDLYGSALSLCNSSPVLSDVIELLVNITSNIIGQNFPYGKPDIEAYSRLFSCLTTQASLYTEFTQESAMIRLFLNATTSMLAKFITIQSGFVEEVISNLNRFSRSIQLSNTQTFTTGLFTLRSAWFKASNVNPNEIYRFSKYGNEISVPDEEFRDVIASDNLVLEGNTLALNYFQEPEIISDIISVEFTNVQTSSFTYSYTINFNTYLHSYSPFSLNQVQSPIFCAQYSNQQSLWLDNIDNIHCNIKQSAGLYAQFAGFRQLEDTIRPFNMFGYIGTLISLIMFSTTVLLYILFFRLLKKIVHFINFVLSLVFICYDILFIFTLEAVYFFETGCKIASIFMHLFLTASFIWLATYTLVCYILISFPHYRFKKKSFVVIFVFATLFSLFIVFPFTPFYHEEYISNSTYFSDSLEERFGYCWVNTQNIGESYYIFLVAVPIIILYFASCIIIGLTLIKDLVSTFGLKSSKKLSRVLLIYIILFGLSWACLLSFLSTNIAILAYISAVLNAIQASFFLFGVVLIPHQEIHQRIEYYTGKNFCKHIRISKRLLPTPRRRVVTQAELAIRVQHEPIVETDSKEAIDESGSDILSSSVDFSKLLKGEKDFVFENEIDIMDPSTFAPPVITGVEAPPRKPSRLKVLTEVETESDITQSEDSKQQELAIYYPISISSRSESQINASGQIDPKDSEVFNSVKKAESDELMDPSVLIQAKFAKIVNSDSFDEKTPPSKRAANRPNQILAFWEKKITEMNRNVKKTGTSKPRERLSIPTYAYADAYLEDQFFQKEHTRMMLPSGRMVTATPPPSEPDENYASSMPELIYLQSRSFSPDMFDELRRQASNELHELDDSLANASAMDQDDEEYTLTPTISSSTDTMFEIENELVADLDTLVNQIDLSTAKTVLK
ncbi:Thrombospondin-3a-like [Oopsacas minuta]|uniref:Thrombospondin-3a-like n=1 Tax=Oopsacas minuta TaxID=111878 RepID=A0AAV7JXD1_9METZ|nr:Thrombospondin-3a-like [Oopsacas minuta]